MSDLVPGIDFVFYAYRGGLWKPYICARSGDDPVETDFIETTGPGSGNWRTIKPTVHGWAKNIQGVIGFDDSGTKLTWPDLRSIQFAKEKLLVRTVYTSREGNTYTEQGYCYIQSSTPTGSFDGISTFTVAFRGTGAITQILTLPPSPTPGDMRYPEQGDTAPATTGAYTWDLPGMPPTLIKLTNVVKDGRGRSDILEAGTPVGNEVLFTANGSDGLLTFPEPFEAGETPPYIQFNYL